VRLAGADPAAAPLIDPNYWADPQDRRHSIEGLKLAREILRQPALKRFVMEERLPGTGTLTDQELFDYGCAHAKTDHHPAGTCRIGRAGDPTSVVTPDLAVIGLAGLRVVDASVMPRVPSSNTNAPTIMVAEKAADHILGRLSPSTEGTSHADSPPQADGSLKQYTPKAQPIRPPAEPAPFSRTVYAAAHVVVDPLATTDPWDGSPGVDWERTMAFREHLWSLASRWPRRWTRRSAAWASTGRSRAS
jgi:hypothetical protein